LKVILVVKKEHNSGERNHSIFLNEYVFILLR